MNEKDKKEFTIDIFQILRILRKYLIPIILITVIAAGATYLIESTLVKPKYKASALVYVQAKKTTDSETAQLSTSDLNVAKQLVDTYSIILKTHNVLDEVVFKLGNQVSFEKIRSTLVCESVNNTEIFSISYTDTDPRRATDIINAIAEIAPDAIKETVKAGVASVVQYADQPTSPVSPSKTRDAAIAGLAALVGSAFIFVLISILDTRVRAVEDLTENFNYPVLGSIPTITADVSAAEKEEEKDE